MTSIFRNQLKFCWYEGSLYRYEVFKGSQKWENWSKKLIVTPYMGIDCSAPFMTSWSKKLIDQFLDSLPAACPADLTAICLLFLTHNVPSFQEEYRKVLDGGKTYILCERLGLFPDVEQVSVIES